METEIKRDSAGRFLKGSTSPNPLGRSKASKAISELAKAYTGEALRTLSSIMKDKSASDNSRVAACNALLNRAYGMPKQHNENVNLGMSYIEYLEMVTEQENIKSVEAGYTIDDL